MTLRRGAGRIYWYNIKINILIMDTRVVSRKTHGMMDYPYSSLVMSSPWLFNFANKGPETWIPVAIGATATISSLSTDYEVGAVKKVPMKTHLNLDVAAGLLLAASPFLFGFYKKVWIPHVALGLVTAGMGLMTKTASLSSSKSQSS